MESVAESVVASGVVLSGMFSFSGIQRDLSTRCG